MKKEKKGDSYQREFPVRFGDTPSAGLIWCLEIFPLSGLLDPGCYGETKSGLLTAMFCIYPYGHQ